MRCLYADESDESGNEVARVRLIDVSDPSTPREVGSLDEEEWLARMAPAGSHLILATRTQVSAWDVSDPAAPVRLANLVAGMSPFSPMGAVGAIAVRDGQVWLAAGDAGVVMGRLGDGRIPVRSRCLLFGSVDRPPGRMALGGVL